jgi:hypothetical protein
MALSDLAVYSEYAYSAMTEVLRQQVDLFNGATEGAITLQSAAHQGDYSDLAFFKNISGLVRRRNAYGAGAVAQKNLAQIVDTMVKVAAGTPPINLSPGQFKWIQMNPEVAGAALGQQLAIQTMADMLDTGLGAWYASHAGIPAVMLNITGNAAPDDTMSYTAQNNAAAKLGDQSGGRIAVWVMHSKPLFDLYGKNLTNVERLFVYGNVNVSRDPFGRLMVMTDSPSLVTPGVTPVYHTLGLVPGAIRIDQNNDFTANEDTRNGDENIQTTYQAEWSFELGILGFAWDKANGGKSPTQAALLTGTNWDRYATSDKDLGGVGIDSH